MFVQNGELWQAYDTTIYYFQRHNYVCKGYSIPPPPPPNSCLVLTQPTPAYSAYSCLLRLLMLSPPTPAYSAYSCLLSLLLITQTTTAYSDYSCLLGLLLLTRLTPSSSDYSCRLLRLLLPVKYSSLPQLGIQTCQASCNLPSLL